MKALFDHNVDRRFRRHLPGHIIRTTREMRWETLSNGTLLAAAAREGFNAVIAIDKNIEYEQNLLRLPLPVIILDAYSNALPLLIPFAAPLLKLLDTRLDNLLYVIERDGQVLSVTSPRRRS